VDELPHKLIRFESESVAADVSLRQKAAERRLVMDDQSGANLIRK